MEHKMSEGTQVQAEEVEAVDVAADEKVKAKKGGDYIKETAEEVEKLTKVKARNLAANLSENIEANYFKLGGVLKVIADNSWFEGYENFGKYVFEEFGFAERKARYLMQIYVDLVDKQIPWAKVAGLGWSKLKDLAPHLTLENVDEWVDKASKLSVAELQAALKATTPTGAGAEKTTDTVVTLKYKVHTDQAETIGHALAKAKGELQVDVDTVALENICALYLTGNSGTLVGGTDLKAAMVSGGWEKVLTIFGEVFPDIDISVGVPDDADKAA
jgi:hypothetical protein